MPVLLAYDAFTSKGVAAMTRAEVLEAYEVDQRGMIRSPGKFEQEMLYVPAMYDHVLNGVSEILDWSDGGRTDIIMVDPEDRAEFPEISADTVALHFEESSTGFVSCEELTEAEYMELLEKNESDVEENEEDEEEEGEEEESGEEAE